MNRNLVLEFTKMHGAGNDFIVIDNRFFLFNAEELSEIAKKYCARHFGIGADGLLALDTPRHAGDHYHMTYFNADGSPGEMCGNGARCLARFAFEAGIVEQPLRFSTVSGHFEAQILSDNASQVRLVLPAPQLVQPNFTVVRVGAESLDLTLVDVGVPHAVWFGTDIDRLPVRSWGAEVRHHPDFHATHGANVDFVEVVSADEDAELKVRCYERGVEDETLACGTGAVSSFAAAVALERIQGSNTAVNMPGGVLRVGYIDGGKAVFLTGPAETVFRGTIEI